ncbi:MAG: SPFH domain-containing protein [Spirochaetaceae bacterium]
MSGSKSRKERRSVLRAVELPRRPEQFAVSTLSTLLLAVAFVAAVLLQFGLRRPPSPEAVVVLFAVVAVAAVVLSLLPLWPVDLALVILLWAAGGYYLDSRLMPALWVLTAGLLFAPSIQLVKHWERVVIFRLGRFSRAVGPGPHLLIPVIDTVVARVDMRIRVTDFSAERSVTQDTVPVHVDALAFWMVWDARKAILEVQDYVAAVTLSAQTALRDAVGHNELATLLSERERLGAEIQEILDAKTSPWGITILSIEFTEVLLPQDLENALSRKAQAARERQARVILSSAEVEIAEKFEEAGRRYEANPKAFELRAMNMVYDGMQRNQNLMLVPTQAVESMGTGTALAMAAFGRARDAGEEASDRMGAGSGADASDAGVPADGTGEDDDQN